MHAYPHVPEPGVVIPAQAATADACGGVKPAVQSRHAPQWVASSATHVWAAFTSHEMSPPVQTLPPPSSWIPTFR